MPSKELQVNVIHFGENPYDGPCCPERVNPLPDIPRHEYHVVAFSLMKADNG